MSWLTVILFSNHGIAPENFSFPAEGISSGTISPRTLPSSTDDNFHTDESWPHFQLLNSVTNRGMPMESNVLYPYAKGPTTSTGAVIVDDADMPAFSDASTEAIMSFQQAPSPFSLLTEPWSGFTPDVAIDNMASVDGPVPLSMDSSRNHAKDSPFRNVQSPSHSLESRWLDNSESQLPIAQMTSTSLSTISPPLPQKVEPTATDTCQYMSESSSVSRDLTGIYECSHSATSDDPPSFAERQLEEDDSQWKGALDTGFPETSAPQITAFMVSETQAESLVTTIPSRSKDSSSTGPHASSRPTPLAMQSTATVRKRKNRNSTASRNQAQPKPLQIVQEDGQGGSITSADVVSTPRGARRKGPLSMVGRANAGLRRKNKDTCVQCRLNKRKVSVLHFRRLK